VLYQSGGSDVDILGLSDPGQGAHSITGWVYGDSGGDDNCWLNPSFGGVESDEGEQKILTAADSTPGWYSQVWSKSGAGWTAAQMGSGQTQMWSTTAHEDGEIFALYFYRNS
jgi:hypothetical protein